MTLESSPSRARPELGGRSYYDVTGGRYNFKRYVEIVGGSIIPGYQLRYIRFLSDEARGRLAVKPIPFSEINRLGAGMYRGEKILRVGSVQGETAASPAEEGGSMPTPRSTTKGLMKSINYSAPRLKAEG